MIVLVWRSFKWCFQKTLSDPLLCVYLLYWVHEKTWRKRSWMSISYLSLLFSGWLCLNYWFVENAIRVHCGLRQSQTIVQHRSAFFFRPFLFEHGQTTFQSPGGRDVLVRRGQRVDRFCLVHSTFILKESAFCWLVCLHTQIWPTESTIERLFNFWWLRDDGVLAQLSSDWSFWQPETDLWMLHPIWLIPSDAASHIHMKCLTMS